ncbi:MAG: iron-sulfur cluster assembly scaffold protein [Candidatus Bathyarchaeota archaeon]|nr:iron-sulfur cluster assembly scaffold protein [Candidatus Bathyarchaeum sp.]
MSGERALLEKSGYSKKAIDYYESKLNVGEIINPDAHFSYTGPCGDTMEIFLKIESNIITDAKFRAIGCAGSYVSASSLTEMIKGKTIKEAKKFDEKDILKNLGKIPAPKIHCACLAKKTLQKAIQQYTNKKHDIQTVQQ